MYIEWRHRDGEWQADENHKVIEQYEDYDYIQQVNATGRNYHLFAALAGVRGDGPEPKGIPEDASETIKRALPYDDYGNYHSHSYYSLDEFKQILIECEYDLNSDTRPIAFYEWGNYSYDGRDEKPKTPADYVCLVHYCEQLKNTHYADNIILGEDDGREDIEIRLVFAFDN
jgi:hypothetical protein